MTTHDAERELPFVPLLGSFHVCPSLVWFPPVLCIPNDPWPFLIYLCFLSSLLLSKRDHHYILRAYPQTFDLVCHSAANLVGCPLWLVHVCLQFLVKQLFGGVNQCAVRRTLGWKSVQCATLRTSLARVINVLQSIMKNQAAPCSTVQTEEHLKMIQVHIKFTQH